MSYRPPEDIPRRSQLMALADNLPGGDEPSGRKSLRRSDTSKSIDSFSNHQSHKSLVEDRPVDTRSHLGSRFVMTKSNPLRVLWTVTVTLLLVYTGTVFLYRLCFIDFRIPTEAEAKDPSLAPGASDAADWGKFDTLVAYLFWIDLVINFFFSYDEEDSPYEVDDLRLIARQYLKSHFWINVFACVPDEVIEFLISSYTADAPQNLNQTARALRLQRMSRLARLTRLTRLAKLKQQSQSWWFQMIERQKGFRIINLMIGLLWVMHFVACGWYLCASLHESSADTWVARRSTDPDGTAMLIDSQPLDQWLHAMYFALTVFTTVGFGDISAVTIGEIFYACFAMGVGALVHSIIISEVINVVVSTDEVQAFIKKQTDLVQAFADHTELEFDISRRLRRWVDASAKQWAAEKYDRNEMKEILTGKFLPRELVEQLPAAVFSGQLLNNNFLWVCRNICKMPPRLPLLVALALSKSTFQAMEFIYQVNDYSFNMFLVAKGTFAYVARPSREGGIPEVQAELSRSEVPWARKPRRKSVVLKAVGKVANMLKKTKAADEVPEMTLFPCVLFGRNSYFGDEGLARAAPRAHTARCESEHGELLSLSKVDMKDLGDQFPQFGVAWAFLARQHERRHREQQKKLTFGCTYRHLAAMRIQCCFKDHCLRALRRSKDLGGCSEALERFTDVATSMIVSAGRTRSRTDEPGLVAVQRDLDRLQGIVVGLADKVGSLLSHLEKHGSAQKKVGI